jgi:hypothetical protein
LERTTARTAAEDRVASVAQDPDGRVELTSEFYRHQSRAAYATAHLSFLRWNVKRGSLAGADASVPGSPWWRAVGDRLLVDMLEADEYHRRGRDAPTTVPTALWLDFLRYPTPPSWYRAHNASVVAGYLEHEMLAAQELLVERFLLNVALLRVLYAHALVAAPRLALGPLAALGPRIGDPRGRTVDLFLGLGRVFPHRYPVHDIGLEDLLAHEQPLARVMDYGIIGPRLAAVYQFAAASLGEPRLARLLRDGMPAYSWPSEHRAPWLANREQVACRLAARATGTAL